MPKAIFVLIKLISNKLSFDNFIYGLLILFHFFIFALLFTSCKSKDDKIVNDKKIQFIDSSIKTNSSKTYLQYSKPVFTSDSSFMLVTKDSSNHFIEIQMHDAFYRGETITSDYLNGRLVKIDIEFHKKSNKDSLNDFYLSEYYLQNDKVFYKKGNEWRKVNIKDIVSGSNYIAYKIQNLN